MDAVPASYQRSRGLVPAYILAGGRSSRFGSDKARAIFQSEPLIARINRQLSRSCSSVTIVADQEAKYSDLGLVTIADRRPGLGPMGGLETSLIREARMVSTAADADSSDGWLLLCSCDLLNVHSQWLSGLLHERCHHEAQAVAFRDETGRWEPLFALYHVDGLNTVSRMCAGEDRSMQRLLDAVSAVSVALPDDWPAIAQVNTRVELAAAEDLANQQQPR